MYSSPPDYDTFSGRMYIVCLLMHLVSAAEVVLAKPYLGYRKTEHYPVVSDLLSSHKQLDQKITLVTTGFSKTLLHISRSQSWMGRTTKQYANASFKQYWKKTAPCVHVRTLKVGSRRKCWKEIASHLWWRILQCGGILGIFSSVPCQLNSEKATQAIQQ